MGWTVLYIAFGLVALWLLGEVLLQYKARLRWRLVAFFGFLGVVLGVLMLSVPVIVLGTVAFATGQTFVTLSFRRGFSTGWALGGRPATSRRRRPVGEGPTEAEHAPLGPDGAASPEAEEAYWPEQPQREPDPEASPMASEPAYWSEQQPAESYRPEPETYRPEPMPDETAEYGVYRDRLREPAPAAYEQRYPGADEYGGYPAADGYGGYSGTDRYATADYGPDQQGAYPDQNQGQYADAYGYGDQQYAAYSDPYIGGSGAQPQAQRYEAYQAPYEGYDQPAFSPGDAEQHQYAENYPTGYADIYSVQQPYYPQSPSPGDIPVPQQRAGESVGDFPAEPSGYAYPQGHESGGYPSGYEPSAYPNGYQQAPYQHGYEQGGYQGGYETGAYPTGPEPAYQAAPEPDAYRDADGYYYGEQQHR